MKMHMGAAGGGAAAAAGGTGRPLCPLPLSSGHAKRLVPRGPQSPCPGWGPRRVLTANSGACGGTCGERRVTERWPEDPGASPLQSRGAGGWPSRHCAGPGTRVTTALRQGAVISPFRRWRNRVSEPRSTLSGGLLVRGASHAPLLLDFRLSGPLVKDREVGGYSGGRGRWGVREHESHSPGQTRLLEALPEVSTREKPQCVLPAGDMGGTARQLTEK